MDAPCVLVGQWVSSKQTEWMDFCQPQKGSLFKSSLISLTARTPINRRQPSSRSNGCLLMGLPTEQFLQGMYLQDPPSEPLLGIQEKVSLACCSSNCIVLALDNNEGFLFCQWDAQGATLMQKKRLPPLPEWEGSPIHFMSLSTDTSSLAICFDSIIYVYLLETEQVIILQGHIGRVNQVLFLDSLNPEWVLSISDDRRFKVWDIGNRACIYQSAILTPQPLLHLAFDPEWSRLCFSSEDGVLFFYEMLGPNIASNDDLEFKLAPKELKRIDIMKVWEKCWAQMDALQPTKESVISISSVPTWRDKSKACTETSTVPESRVDSVRIVKLHYHSKSHDADDGQLIVGCSNGFIIMDPRTYTTLYFTDFQRTPLPMEMSITLDEDLNVDNPTTTIPLADSFSFLPVQGISNTLLLLTRNAFSRQYNLMTVVIPSFKIEETPNKSLPSRLSEKGRPAQLDQLIASSVSSRVKGKWADGIYRECLNQLASVQIRSLDDLSADKELPAGLPSYVVEDLDLLRKANSGNANGQETVQALSLSVIDEEKDILFRKKIASKTLTKTPVKGKKVSTLDKPVTFRTRVKSSGYTLSPVATKMFTSPTAQKSAMKKGAAMPPKLKPMYPVDAGLPIAPHKKSFTIQHASGVLGLSYHSSGKFLATGSSDQIARSYKLPGGTTKDLIGHNGMVSDVSWSLDGHSYFGPLLLTSCTDGRSRLWASEKSEALLEIYAISGSQKRTGVQSPSGGPTKEKPDVFSSPIISSRFFYKDSCIAIASGQSVYLYNYSIEKPDFGSIKPGFSPNRYRLLSSFSGQCQSLTAFTCATAFKSHVLFGATSDKTLCLWDAVTGQQCGRIKDAHSRWIHSLALADYETIPSAFSNVLLTSAVSDGLKAWDIRTQKPIMSFLGHQNRSAAVGCALSPCGRFIATGSEDKHGYLFDFRRGSIVAKTRGSHLDAVVSVAFCPLVPELATGSLDGQVRFFRPEGPASGF